MVLSFVFGAKRKANVIRHMKLIHGIDARTFGNNDTKNNDTKNDAGVSAVNDYSASKEYKKCNFHCNKCLYNTVKKYNLMRHLKSIHLKSIHSPKERRRDEDLLNEEHYTRSEFEEIMIRLKDQRPNINAKSRQSRAGQSGSCRTREI